MVYAINCRRDCTPTAVQVLAYKRDLEIDAMCSLEQADNGPILSRTRHYARKPFGVCGRMSKTIGWQFKVAAFKNSPVLCWAYNSAVRRECMPIKDKKKQAVASHNHYLLNKDKMKQRAALYSKKQRILVQQFVFEYLLKHPCVDCGEKDTIVLEFDHIPGKEKRFVVGCIANRGYSIKSVAEEIAKCEVRCASCHRRITYKRAGRKHRG